MNPLRRLARATGLAALYWRLRQWRELAPTWLVNFLFQRVFGLNRACRWSVHFTSRVMHPAHLEVHPSSRLSFAVSGGCYIQATNGIRIGANTIFAPGVKLISANHDPESLDCGAPAAPIVIGSRCWIGANAVVLPGVALGDGVIVGAGAVVTRSFPPGAVVGGVPARLLRQRDGAAVRPANPSAS